MHLLRLEATDFRNLPQVDLEPIPGFNVLVGENGQGKTNLIEAIYWLAALRPLRATRNRELVRWGQPGARVAGVVASEGLEHRMEVRLKGSDREAVREGKTVRAADYLGRLVVIPFTPDDVGLVRAAPGERRQYLDRAVFNGRPAHLKEVLELRRALSARNELLRNGGDDVLLASYEEALARAASRVIDARRQLVAEIAPRFVAAFQAIVGPEPAIELGYRSSAPEGTVDEVAAALAMMWAEDRPRDRERGFTQRGPHADDLSLRMVGRSAKAYASQGQQRAMVLALKIAEIGLLTDRRDLTPVLLLDDVSSELDADRNARLFEFLNEFEGQVFITTTDVAYLRIEGAARVFRVRGGHIEREEG